VTTNDHADFNWRTAATRFCSAAQTLEHLLVQQLKKFLQPYYLYRSSTTYSFTTRTSKHIAFLWQML